ncbi:hypothetical protein EIP91_011051 [Steccherinum ochraceum]|uniref:DUF7719 domain-containing protein n=1 Tax=Steccherinum ochraceum TaxID=92696 RepID=A0A4R0RQW2_9APHY|nr:hypothetical protein EIP91_011051 [Steccherinum ochraceum]
MAKKRKPSQVPQAEEKPLVDISEQDQWKIIKDSGILEQVPRSAARGSEEQLLSPLTEELFAAFALIIPHCFLLLMMEFLIHYQYGRRPTKEAILERMIPGVPIIALFIFYTSRYKRVRIMQLGFFLLSLASSIRLIYIINRTSWLVNMKQAPPLATLAVYCVVQSDLLPAFLSILITGIWVRYANMKLLF